MKKDIILPFDYIIVPGSEAIKTCMEIRKDTSRGVTPIILGDAAEIEYLEDSLEYNNHLTPQSIIKQSENVNIKDFLNNRYAEFATDDESLEEWPSEDVESHNGLVSIIDFMTGNPLDEVYIALIPTLNSYKVPAYLKYGDWNDCPSPEEHIAIFKYWYEKYGARIIAVTHDIIECTVDNPPKTKEEAIKLAKEQFKYCIDIVAQGTETISGLAASLLNSKYWYFWWD